jgi:hypothetical protein
MTIKNHFSRSLVAFFLLNAGFVFAGGFKSKIITASPLTITVPEDRFLRITNFTQDGGTDRGVVGVTLSGDAGGTASVLTATRIDFSTGINSQNFPEIGNQVTIAGPAAVRVPPVAGATLLISYRKQPNQAGFKSKIITTSPLTIPVPEDRFLKIPTFTQDGGTDHGVVRVNLSRDGNGAANVLTATRIDFSTGVNSQNFPEINNQAIVAGPADVRIAPVMGATLLVTYQKGANEGGGGGEEATPIPIVSPTPSGTATPSATPISTATPPVTPAPTPTLTPTPMPTSTPVPTPTSTPRPTRTPRPPS